MTSSQAIPGAAPGNPDLPVAGVLPRLGEILAGRPTAILTAEPGAGKTTLVPLFLAGQPWCTGRVIVLEPRRIAARAAARFVAAGLGEKPGATVGYRVRLESRVSGTTRVEYVTEGVFSRMALDDPELAGISAVSFDEFHERSLDADVGLALALDIQSALRPDLRILVMSATLEIDRLAAFLGNAPIVASKGRAFAVETRYRPRGPHERVEDAVSAAILAALAAERGSLLAFLPGQAEIRRTAERLEGRLPANAELHALHGGLQPGDQDAAIRPPSSGRRKVVLATAIAESSLTIDGVAIVVDSGLARVPRHEPQTGLTRLETVRAPRFSVDQRAGRAGRTAPGVAIRLWHERQNAALPDAGRPEIMEADLASLALDLAAWGTADPAQLRWLDPPPAAAYGEALDLLKRLGALDASGRITVSGKAMRAMPLGPRYARMVLAAAEHGQALEAARLAMLVSERGLGGSSVDLATRLERLGADRSSRAESARNAARRMVSDLPARAAENLSPGALLSLAWPDRIAQARGKGAFRLSNGRGAMLDLAEGLSRAPYLVVADLQGRAAAGRIVSAAAISEAEIETLHGDAILEESEVAFDDGAGAVRARSVRRLGALELAVAQVAPEPDEAITVLLAAIRRKGLAVLDWRGKAGRLRRRIAFLHAHAPADWPDVGDEVLMTGLEDWLAPFIGDATALAGITPDRLLAGLDFLLARQGRRRADVDRELPETYTTPAGSRIALRYETDAVILPVRVQELYGLGVHPAIGGGAIALTLELLSPAQRPIQVTRDLPGFWSGSWKEVRVEMRGRYPRHYWPEDPLVARPTTRTRPPGP
ncbi:MAG: ATP-dependent helicase HrpB [Pseudomonadota bacterium]|nr:ATP-dependent helicase HrpB [Pseudomonadota bacterium]